MSIVEANAQLIQNVARLVELNEDEKTQLVTLFKPARIKKRQFLVQPGFVARHRSYVVDGSFRAYVVGEQGKEYTISLAIQDWWITDYNSYIFQNPASMFVEALEDSTILQLVYEDEQKLKQSRHVYERFFRIMAERTAAYNQRRIISNLTMTAEERYHQFLDKYPSIAAKIPQYALASFLDMSTEFLSKIRNRRMSSKPTAKKS
jgi:CRP-like cAMP-binding protein